MNRAPRPPVPAPIGLSPPGDGIPWLRLVMGMVLLVVSFAVSQQAAHRPAPATLPAVPHPVTQRFVAGVPLAPLEAGEPLASAASPATAPATRLASAAPSGAREPRTAARSGSKPLRVAVRTHRRSAHWRVRPVVLASQYGTSPWSPGCDQVPAAKLTRRRADVRREFIAARNVVAALTGEDSGSAYLTRTAARARAHPLGRHHHHHRAGRAAT